MRRKDLEQLADVAYNPKDIAAAIASGSFLTEGMVIAPCSMKTLAAVAHAHADDLVSRAADVVLKERRRLVLVPRETPLNLAHLRNMTAVTEMGAIVMPPVPAFYAMPKIDRGPGRAHGGPDPRPLRRALRQAHPLAGDERNSARARLNASGCSMLERCAACGISTSFAPGDVLAGSRAPSPAACRVVLAADRPASALDLLQARGDVDLRDRRAAAGVARDRRRSRSARRPASPCPGGSCGKAR